jgi:hypothetical protein
MQIALLDLKATMDRDGVKMIDFLDNNFTVNYLSPDFQVMRIVKVEEHHLCRIDLIAFEAYGSVDQVDAVLKFNMITNPFSMEVGDILVIPSLSSVSSFFKRSSQAQSHTILDTKSIFIDTSRASKKDAARLEQLARIASKRKNGASEIKPTNLLRNGEVPFATTGGALRLAPNATK